MKLRNKLITILSITLLIGIAFEKILGEVYFEKIFRYFKIIELKKIDFIEGSKINFKKLEDYQEKNNTFVLIYKDNKIQNLNSFDYIKIKDKKEEKIVLMNAFLDNLYSAHSFDLKDNKEVEIQGIHLIGNYYFPTIFKLDNKVFKDYKFSNTNIPIENIHGKILKYRTYSNSGLGDDFLEAFVELDIMKTQNKMYQDADDDDKFQLISMTKDGYRVVIFYSYEHISDIVPTLEMYFYLKAFLVLLITLFFGAALEKIFINPIVSLSNITKDISNLKFKSKYKYKKNDEIGNLYRDIEEMSEKLEYIISLYKEELKENKNAQIKLEESIKVFMHEVKTPLSVIIGFSELLAEDYEEDELEIINSEGKRILKMANEVLEKNQYFSKELKLNCANFYLDSLIELIVKIVETDKVDISVNIPYKTTVFGDREKLEQVILNILNNSVQYSRGKISIYFKKDTLFIENNGENILEENLPKIWNKFYSTNPNGNGLGLYLASQILQAHKFSYSVENLKDGVRFHMVLGKSEEKYEKDLSYKI